MYGDGKNANLWREETRKFRDGEKEDKKKAKEGERETEFSGKYYWMRRKERPWSSLL